MSGERRLTDKAFIRRCAEVLRRCVQISGGDFFTRRSHNDGPVIWKLLSISPFRRKYIASKDGRRILLQYRANSQTLDADMAKVFSLEIQVAILNMIAEIASNKRSASALEVVLKKMKDLNAWDEL